MKRLKYSCDASSDDNLMLLDVSRMTNERLDEICKKYNLLKAKAINPVLYLCNEGFEKIECLEEYVQLKYLWLHRNAITQIGGLENQTNLSHLYLQFNLISRIENLNGLKNLHTLNLSSNRIEKIENIGSDILPVLTKLDLSYNYLWNADSVRELETCLQLTDLNLNNNRIAHLPVIKVLGKIPKLRTLNFNKNSIASILSQYRTTIILECNNLTYLDMYPVYLLERENARKWLAVDSQISTLRKNCFLKRYFHFKNECFDCDPVILDTSHNSFSNDETSSDESEVISDADISAQFQVDQCENLNELSIVPLDFAEKEEPYLSFSDDENTCSHTSISENSQKEWVLKAPCWERVYHNIKRRANNECNENKMGCVKNNDKELSDLKEIHEITNSEIESLQQNKVVLENDLEYVNSTDNSIGTVLTLIDYNDEESKLLSEIHTLETDKDCLKKINDVQRNFFKDNDKRRELSQEINKYYMKIFCENLFNNIGSQISTNDTVLQEDSCQTTPANSINEMNSKTSDKPISNLHVFAENIAKEMYIKYKNSNIGIRSSGSNDVSGNINGVDYLTIDYESCHESDVKREIYPQLKTIEESDEEEVPHGSKCENLDETVYSVVNSFKNFLELLDRKKSEETARKAEVERLMLKYSKYLEPQNTDSKITYYRDYGPKRNANVAGTIQNVEDISLSKENDTTISKAIVTAGGTLVEYINPISIKTVQNVNERNECSDLFEYHSTMHDNKMFFDDFSRSINRFSKDDGYNDDEITFNVDESNLPNDIVLADIEFLEKLDFEKIKLDDSDENCPLVECAQSYEELKKFVDCNDLNSALTDDEIVILNEILEISMANKNSMKINSEKHLEENILLQKLFERVLYSKENYEHDLNNDQLKLMYKCAHLFATTEQNPATSQNKMTDFTNSNTSETKGMLRKLTTPKKHFKGKVANYNVRTATKQKVRGKRIKNLANSKNKLKNDKKEKNSKKSEGMACANEPDQKVLDSPCSELQYPNVCMDQSKTIPQDVKAVNRNSKRLIELLDEFSKGVRNKENTADMIFFSMQNESPISSQCGEEKKSTSMRKDDVVIKKKQRKHKFSARIYKSRLSVDSKFSIYSKDLLNPNGYKFNKSVKKAVFDEEEIQLLEFE
ncbi:dynein assembly factor 1, axonemal homolog [Teleopsis dalmanni]|uniref:dynein assembly factor 1, axonemal homolog n=1 Tax=Teleopsis dalmanni TaxID=139649 RepID=UPI0018CCD3BC|nr:dynein assembly factor 1, axonemal homolog [Teleopsis dalmanni]XP_037960374.1 dynein assembly factor 1, axonemal homolog [Teleopsis dalmanni]XP_037960376.1 dynein assembly factor 1, axonemal homolog [Teleopsis dalmanni]